MVTFLFTILLVSVAEALTPLPLRFRVRRFERSDLKHIADLAEAEFTNPTDGNMIRSLFRFQISLGFEMRLAMFESTEGSDHAVFVLSDDMGSIGGLIEISKQPKWLAGPAPMLPPPPKLKKLLPDLEPYISNILVDPNFRREGFGSDLMRMCHLQCLEWGYDTCYLDVDAEDEGAIGFYEAMNYKTCRQDPKWVKYLRGFRLRRMKKQLDR